MSAAPPVAADRPWTRTASASAWQPRWRPGGGEEPTGGHAPSSPPLSNTHARTQALRRLWDCRWQGSTRPSATCRCPTCSSPKVTAPAPTALQPTGAARRARLHTCREPSKQSLTPPVLPASAAPPCHRQRQQPPRRQQLPRYASPRLACPALRSPARSPTKAPCLPLRALQPQTAAADADSSQALVVRNSDGQVLADPMHRACQCAELAPRISTLRFPLRLADSAGESTAVVERPGRQTGHWRGSAGAQWPPPASQGACLSTFLCGRQLSHLPGQASA